MDNSTNDLIFDVNNFIATIQINRPNKANTVTRDMGNQLTALSTEISERSDVRVVVLRSSGDRHFSAGSDISVLDDYGTPWELRRRRDYCRAIRSITKPVIASVQGYAVGGGLELALCADIRIAAPEATFGVGEIKLGWVGGGGTSQFLPRLIGYGAALKYMLTGDLIDGQEAHRLGIVEELVERDKLEDRVYEIAATIASRAPIAVEASKHAVRMALSTSLDVGLSYENDLFAMCFTTEDHNEGIQAFMERRAPNFKGR